jgi:hypothetical protein
MVTTTTKKKKSIVPQAITQAIADTTPKKEPIETAPTITRDNSVPLPQPLDKDRKDIRTTSQGDTFTLAGFGGIARSEFSSEESYREAKNIREAQGLGTLGGLNPVTGETGGQEVARRKEDVLNAPKTGEKLTNEREIVQADASKDILGTALEKTTDVPVVGRFLSKTAQGISALSSFLPEFLQFGTKKSAIVTQAEQTFSNIISGLNQDVSAVSAGTISSADVQRDIDMAISSIAKLEQQAHGLGRANLRYWLDQGREIETQAKYELRALQEVQNKLIASQLANIAVGR